VIVAGVVPGAIVPAMARAPGAKAPAVVTGAVIAAMAGGAGTETPAVVAGLVIRTLTPGGAVIVAGVVADRIVGPVARLRDARGASGPEGQRDDRSREDQLVACPAHVKNLLVVS
jgi:hypothetical protein